MRKILVPVDGSDSSLRAVAQVIEMRSRLARPETLKLHLLNVQHPLRGDVTMFVSEEQARSYHHDEGIKALARARKLLDKAGIAYRFHIKVGEPGEVIAREADERGCSEIVMGTHGWGSIVGLLMGSVATKVLHQTKVPVLLVK
jgi:nucleotide-binding universal stress UspA family protein